MRPRKTIVIIDPHDDRRGTTRFMLQTKGFRILSAASIAKALEVIANDDRETYLLLGYWPIDETRFAQLSWDFEIPTIYIASANKATVLHAANATLDIATSAMDLLDQIKTMVARKRGPRPSKTFASVHRDNECVA